MGTVPLVMPAVLVAQSLRTRHRPTTVGRLEQMLLERGQELTAEHEDSQQC
ncbi:hypothetical protein MXD63_08555 [Frankia sp. Cpl3]|uniref:hypothetical protein n=1 Tax=Parafrankia colletiae TaxID=573497 RepID=UPI0012FF701D|nr:hypothetical protein [Parafrankia colletiae]MCK9900125.1 hypothetical protein [Frankia sp. Cpl3]